MSQIDIDAWLKVAMLLLFLVTFGTISYFALFRTDQFHEYQKREIRRHRNWWPGHRAQVKMTDSALYPWVVGILTFLAFLILLPLTVVTVVDLLARYHIQP